MVQRVYLSVAEKGTEAAATTGITLQPTAGRVTDARITLDHPFVFLVRDVKTGAILFTTLVNDPSAD